MLLRPLPWPWMLLRSWPPILLPLPWPWPWMLLLPWPPILSPLPWPTPCLLLQQEFLDLGQHFVAGGIVGGRTA